MCRGLNTRLQTGKQRAGPGIFRFVRLAQVKLIVITLPPGLPGLPAMAERRTDG
jgi:hypothetical protein